jgi:hypothetical protein
MWDSQDGINACERAKYDSMALASIPQINVNVNRLAPGQDALEIKPGKIWATTDAPAGSTGKPIEFFTPPSIVADVQRVQQDAMAFCDEQTGLPRSLQGEGGQGIHNRTASGASMQFNSAITPLKGVAFNIDTKLISPMLRNMVKFYDKFSKDKSIVGDFQVVAKGVSGLMAREVVSQKLGNLMQAVSSSPELAKRIDMERVADLLMRGSGLQDSRLVLTEAEVLKREEAIQQQQQVAQAAGQQMQADIQAQSQHKMRAETSPRDVLLQALSEVPDKAVNLKLDMLSAVLAASGLLTPELQASIAMEKDKQQMMDQAMAEELGSKNGSGDMEIIKMQRAEQMKREDREHTMEMMKLKNKSTNGASDAE